MNIYFFISNVCLLLWTTESNNTHNTIVNSSPVNVWKDLFICTTGWLVEGAVDSQK